MHVVPEKTICDYVTNFFSSAPTLEEIIAYRLPAALQVRAHDLLEKNRGGTLSPSEQAELEAFRQLDHLLTIVKAKARLTLKARG